MSRLNDLYYDIKYAFQRVIKGYDMRDVFNLNNHMEERLIKLLIEYKKVYGCYFVCPNEYNLGEIDNDCCNVKLLTTEMSDAILDTLIFHLKWSDFDYVWDKLYENEYSQNIVNKVISISNQNKECAMKLLMLFWKQLWY